jgi:hypothetical protein
MTALIQEPQCVSESGMTLLDYFAAKTMQGWLASYPDDTDAAKVMPYLSGIAEFSYDMAEAMMAERAKRGL